MIIIEAIRRPNPFNDGDELKARCGWFACEMELSRAARQGRAPRKPRMGRKDEMWALGFTSRWDLDQSELAALAAN